MYVANAIETVHVYDARRRLQEQYRVTIDRNVYSITVELCFIVNHCQTTGRNAMVHRRTPKNYISTLFMADSIE